MSSGSLYTWDSWKSSWLQQRPDPPSSQMTVPAIVAQTAAAPAPAARSLHKHQRRSPLRRRSAFCCHHFRGVTISEFPTVNMVGVTIDKKPNRTCHINAGYKS
eukprot:g26367.t1